MSRAAARPAKYFIAFDGQSLNYAPQNPLGGVNDYPHQLMASFPKTAYRQVAASGVSWNNLQSTRWRRVIPYANSGLTNILVMTGGTTDYAEGTSGLGVYDLMGDYAGVCRTAGYDIVICCTTTPAISIAGANETNRLDGNSRVLADVSNYFDYEVAMSEHANLDDYSDPIYYGDSTHFTTAGATVAAGLVQAKLDLIIAAADR